MKKKAHDHQWIYSGRSCCFRLKCSIPGCVTQTTAYHIKGSSPRIGDPVRFVESGTPDSTYGETIEVIGSRVEDKKC